MDRLFPEKRSTVPLDDERKTAVYTILLEVGAFDLKEMEDVENLESADGIGEGTSPTEGETSEVSDRHEVAVP